MRIFIPEKFKLMPLWVFLFAFFVEFMQYINVLKILGLEGNRLLSTIAGTSFSWIDVGCYALGCVIIVAVELVLKKLNKKQETSV